MIWLLAYLIGAALYFILSLWRSVLGLREAPNWRTASGAARSITSFLVVVLCLCSALVWPLGLIASGVLLLAEGRK